LRSQWSLSALEKGKEHGSAFTSGESFSKAELVQQTIPGGITMSFIARLFSSPKVSMPALQPMPQAPTDEESKAEMAEAARKQRIAAQLAKGRASTLLTEGWGVSEKAPTRLKELFGQ
jgi:hypothetical protein